MRSSTCISAPTPNAHATRPLAGNRNIADCHSVSATRSPQKGTSIIEFDGYSQAEAEDPTSDGIRSTASSRWSILRGARSAAKFNATLTRQTSKSPEDAARHRSSSGQSRPRKMLVT
jgi:hypothetical protein